jgi:hypothetical protein
VVGRFFRAGLKTVSRRYKLFVILNWLFFGSLLIGALVAKDWFPFLPSSESVVPNVDNAWLAFFEIFFFNLVVSAFAVVTLSGLVFFAFSPVALAVRAGLWGVLLDRLSTSALLIAVPTLVLEGEGYVLASVAGMVLGLAWIRPKHVFGGEDLSRKEALRRAFRECAGVYVWVVLFLLVAAIVEVATLVVT